MPHPHDYARVAVDLSAELARRDAAPVGPAAQSRRLVGQLLYRTMTVIAATVTALLWTLAAASVALVVATMSATRLPRLVAYLADATGAGQARAQVGDALFELVPYVAFANVPLTVTTAAGWWLYRLPRQRRRIRVLVRTGAAAAAVVAGFAWLLGGRPG